MCLRGRRWRRTYRWRRIFFEPATEADRQRRHEGERVGRVRTGRSAQRSRVRSPVVVGGGQGSGPFITSLVHSHDVARAGGGAPSSRRATSSRKAASRGQLASVASKRTGTSGSTARARATNVIVTATTRRTAREARCSLNVSGCYPRFGEASRRAKNAPAAARSPTVVSNEVVDARRMARTPVRPAPVPPALPSAANHIER